MADRSSRRQRFRSPEVDIDLTAETALEGPQTVVRWGTSAYTREGLTIVRRQYQEPFTVADGTVVFSCERTPTVSVWADTLVRPKTDYYYGAFGWLNGEYVQIPSGTAWAFSGAQPALEETDKATVLFRGISSGKAGVVQAGSHLGIGTREFYVEDALDIVAGTWLRIGDQVPVDVLVLSVAEDSLDSGSRQLITAEAPEDVVPTYNRGPVRYERLTFKASDAAHGGKSTLLRAAGSWSDDGFAKASRVRVKGSDSNDDTYVVQQNVADGGKTLVFLGGAFVDEINDGRAAVYLPFGKQPGEKVVALRQRGTELQRHWYEKLVPPTIQQDDMEIAAQGRDLVLETLESGEKANLGQPGLQFGYERWVRWLCADLDRARSAIASLPALYDPLRSPASYLRQWGRRYGIPLSSEVTAQRLRAFVEAQPALMAMRGRRDVLRTWLRALTGQTPIFRYGRDRCVGFGEGDSGFAQSGIGLPTALTASVLTDDTASYEPGSLIGETLMIFLGDDNWTDVIVDNDEHNIEVGALDLATVGFCVDGTADDPEPTYLTAVGLEFESRATTGSGNDEITWPGEVWFDHGWRAGMGLMTFGPANAANRGPFQVETVVGDLLTTTATGSISPHMVTESAPTAWAEGGVTQLFVFDKDAPWGAVDTLVGGYAIPDVTDTGGPGGRPRALPISAPIYTLNDYGVLTSYGPHDIGAPGSDYRLASPYRIIRQLGGERDPRTSFYTDDPENAFNERGLFIYLADALETADAREVEQFLRDWRRACLTVLLYADDVLLLEAT